jgi:hypothetical protein
LTPLANLLHHAILQGKGAPHLPVKDFLTEAWKEDD